LRVNTTYPLPIASVRASIAFSNGTKTIHNLSQQSSDIWTLDLSDLWLRGVQYVNISSNNTGGYAAFSNGHQFNVYANGTMSVSTGLDTE